jgi:hypothetical protein
MTLHVARRARPLGAFQIKDSSMDEIKRQVRVARRRMLLQRFLVIVAWSLFATLLVATVGLAIPKIRVVPVDPQVWMWSWLGGAFGVGLLIAVVWTCAVRSRLLEAAVEIDRRFQLKERVSSALALHPDELDSEVGQLLIQDAVRRVERIDVRDSFPVRADWRALLPLLPGAAIFALVLLVPDASPDAPAQAATVVNAEAQRVNRSAQELRKRLAEREKKAREDGLEDIDLILKQLQQGVEDLATKSDADRQQAMIQLNDLAKSLEKRREQLGGADQMKNNLNRLKDLQQGPADKIAQAMKDGDFQKAIDELRALQERLRNDELAPEEREQLAKQLEQLRDKLQQTVDAHQQARQELQKQIQQKMNAGDMDGAGKLQRQLDQLNQMNQAMDRMQQMADNLAQCRECLQNGQAAEAAAQLQQLAEQFQDLQDSMNQLEMLDELMEELAMAKEAMGCKQCDGLGCGACQGQFGFGQQPGPPGMGMGEGQGFGQRPEEQTGTSFYESQVRGEVRPGAAVVTGTAGGPNRAGKSLVEVQEEISSNLARDSDPLVDLRLPRKESDHARQYFERLREGQ